MQLHSAILSGIISLACFTQALPQGSVKKITPTRRTPTPLTPIESVLAILSAALPSPPLPPPTPTVHPSTVWVTVTPGGGVVTSTKLITSVTFLPPPTLPVSTKVVFITAKTRRDEAPVATSTFTPKATATAAPLSRRKDLMPDPGSLPSPGDLYVCADPNFAGECQYIHSTTYKCHNLPFGFAGKISSIRPDANQVCSFYTDSNCQEPSKAAITSIKSPDITDLASYGLDNAVLSWKCWDLD
ncbi:Beta gamma crystallin [Pyrenophora seminiperda CCB06]|uniref:Beta gamma crystallin n=1 Tax=Pyrenophora seminiperda CCB06 TaxID=1302712 RepID=A0A3M7MI88_9PLEO|nr:Beta gamma crystallin [Pyrenophora seminiperda CCB06]